MLPLFKGRNVTHMSVCLGAYLMEWKRRDARALAPFFLSSSAAVYFADKLFSPVQCREKRLNATCSLLSLGL